MSELSTPEGDHIYPGGSMTPEEFMDAEFRVDRDLPPYPNPQVPSIEVKDGANSVVINPFNSSVIRYEEEPTMYDHILTPRRMYFYNWFERYKVLAKTMMEHDFPLLLHHKEPHPDVKQALEKQIRGAVSMADVISRIITESEQDGTTT